MKGVISLRGKNLRRKSIGEAALEIVAMDWSMWSSSTIYFIPTDTDNIQ